jgi:GH15 family glucan-1,4-alpha-glucosidase
MPAPIEDDALIGDAHPAGLVSREGSIDWPCLRRFDSSACFAALRGDEGDGRWRLAPRGPVREVRRRYQLGNFPQAFSRVAQVNMARNLSEPPAPAWARYRG